MCDPNILNIDIMNYNVNLAHDYFEQNKHVFHGSVHENHIVKSDGFNKIYCNNKETQNNFRQVDSDLTNIQHQFNILTHKIKESAELFSQIEFLIRKRPVDEVLKFDIPLIVQNLIYHATSNTKTIFDDKANTLYMGATTPLAYLGYVAQIYKTFKMCCIVATPGTAVISHLFTNICHMSGMEAVYLLLYVDIPFCGQLNMGNGCLGVVTGQADVDSAVDALLTTTSEYPWKLSRILVQESVYEPFKKAMQWKTRREPGKEVEDTPSNAKLCSAFYVYRNKKFLVDYGGTDTDGGITVEAYRTTKELLSMVSKEEPFMSLWSSNINEANEIVHHENSPYVIWVNEYGVFDGPPVSSQAIYQMMTQKSVSKTIVNNSITDLKSKQTLWLKRSFEDRFQTIYFIISNFILENNLKEGQACTWLRSLQDWNGDDIIRVQNNTMCICKTLPGSHPVVISEDNWHDFARLLAIGNQIVMPSLSNYRNGVIERLVEAGLPVALNDSSTARALSSRTKVVWSNHGTMFAN